MLPVLFEEKKQAVNQRWGLIALPLKNETHFHSLEILMTICLVSVWVQYIPLDICCKSVCCANSWSFLGVDDSSWESVVVSGLKGDCWVHKQTKCTHHYLFNGMPAMLSCVRYTVHIDSVPSYAPAAPQRMQEIRDHTVTGNEAVHPASLKKPMKGKYVRDFFKVRGKLIEVDWSMIRVTKSVIPTSMRTEIIEGIHDGHQGLESTSHCGGQDRGSIWNCRLRQEMWPKGSM